jgi:hypothetical protein
VTPFAHPAFAPYLRWLGGRNAGAAVSLATLNDWTRAAGIALPDGRPLVFVAPPPGRLAALAYERRIATRGEVPTREGNRHDLFNALAWLAFPRTKAALNAIHVAAPVTAGGNARDRSRDTATLFDESGLVVACADPGLMALWRAHAWHDLFWRRRTDVVAGMRVAAIGHGLLERLAAPFRALTARVLAVAVDAAVLPGDPRALCHALDAAAAARIAARGAALQPEELLPLPVAALPGWDAEALGERLFDDVTVFRPRAAR